MTYSIALSMVTAICHQLRFKKETYFFFFKFWFTVYLWFESKDNNNYQMLLDAFSVGLSWHYVG